MSEEKSGQATEELDLQAILKKAEQQTTFPDVPLDEFEPPTYDEWKEAKKSYSNKITAPEEKARKIKQEYIREYRGR